MDVIVDVGDTGVTVFDSAAVKVGCFMECDMLANIEKKGEN